MKLNRVTVGHPVDVASGAVFTAWIDCEFPGLPPLLWRRFYSTAAVTSGPLGLGWTTLYLMRIEANNEMLNVVGEEGHEHAFPTPAEGHISHYPGHGWSLRRLGNSLILNDMVRRERLRFEPFTPTAWRLCEITAEAGGRICLHYGQDGSLAAIIQEPFGRTLVFSHDKAGRIAAISLDCADRSPTSLVTYRYDEGGRLALMQDAAGLTLAYDYDATGRMTSETTPAGACFRFEYGPDGACTRTWGDGHVLERQLQYSANPRATLVRTRQGHKTLYFHNASGSVHETRDALGHVTRNVTSALFSQTISPRGATFTRFYDEHGLLQRVVNEAGQAFTYVYDVDGRGTKLIDPDGNARRFDYDARGRCCAITDATGNTWRLERDMWGRITREIDPEGRVLTRTYGPTNEWKEMSDGVATLRCEFDPCGRPTALWRNGEAVARYVHDDSSRRILVRDWRNKEQVFSFGRSGYVEEMRDFDGTRWRIKRDAFGNTVERSSALGLSARMRYDDERRLVALRTPGGATLAYQRNALGFTEARREFDGSITRVEYDEDTNPISIRLADGSVWHRTFDFSGRLVSQSAALPAVGGGMAAAHEFGHYQWDWRGHLLKASGPGAEIEFVYDPAGRIVGERQNAIRLSYAYDRSGKLVRREIADMPGGTVEFSYDGTGCLAQIADAGGVVQQLQRDVAGRRLRRTMRGGFEEMLQYDLDGRIVEQEVRGDGRTIVRRRYAYDGIGNLAQVEDTLRGLTAYAYDPDGRLIAVRRNGRDTETFLHDADGNIVAFGGQAAAYDVGSRLRRLGRMEFDYDALGRLVRRRTPDGETAYDYDALGRLVGVATPRGERHTFRYDPIGRLIARCGPRGEIIYVWSNRHPAGIVSAGQALHILLDSRTWQPTATWLDGVAVHCVCDNFSRPMELLRPNAGIVWRGEFTAFGRMHAQGVGVMRFDIRFPGQIGDEETGLHYNGARHYDPDIGRFLTPDPIGTLGGLNLYDYPRDPVNWMDPTGLACPNPKLIAEDPVNGWQIFEHSNGDQKFTIRADCRRGYATPKPGGLRDSVNHASGNWPEAHLGQDGRVIVMEGTHRAAAAAQGHQIPPDPEVPHLGGVPGMPGHMEFEYHPNFNNNEPGVPLQNLPCPPNYPHKW
jgi:RHS repeat-associated protein